jgi:hypothetical protein
MAVTAANQPLLIPQNLFRCPRCGTAASIPTAQLVSAGAQLNPLAGFCNRCEHPYQFSASGPSTTLSGAHAQGAAALTVVAGAAFSTAGALVAVDLASAVSPAEIVVVSSAGGSTSIPVAATALRQAHPGGTAVQTVVLSPLGPMT